MENCKRKKVISCCLSQPETMKPLNRNKHSQYWIESLKSEVRIIDNIIK